MLVPRHSGHSYEGRRRQGPGRQRPVHRVGQHYGQHQLLPQNHGHRRYDHRGDPCRGRHHGDLRHGHCRDDHRDLRRDPYYGGLRHGHHCDGRRYEHYDNLRHG